MKIVKGLPVLLVGAGLWQLLILVRHGNLAATLVLAALAVLALALAVTMLAIGVRFTRSRR